MQSLSYVTYKTNTERFFIHFFTLILELLLKVELNENIVDDLSVSAVLNVALFAVFRFEHFK